jgi:hypothetical protein
VAVTFCLETEDTWSNTADLPQVMNKYLSLGVVLIVCFGIVNFSRFKASGYTLVSSTFPNPPVSTKRTLPSNLNLLNIEKRRHMELFVMK